MTSERRAGMVNCWMERATWFLMVTPFLMLALFLTLALHLRIGLGTWPTYASDAYHTAAFQVHEQAFTALASFTIWGAIPLWLILLCVRRFQPTWSWKPAAWQALVYLAGWLLIVAFIALNPGRMFDWYLD